MCMYSTMGKKKPYQKKSREVLDSTQKTYIGSSHLGFNIHPTSLTNQAARGRICCILTLGMDLTALPLFGTCLRSPATEHQIILPGCLHPLQSSLREVWHPKYFHHKSQLKASEWSHSTIFERWR